MRHFSSDDVRAREVWCEKCPTIYVLQKEDRILVPVLRMVAAGSSKHYLSSFSTGAALKEIRRSEKRSKSRWGVVRADERNQQVS